MNCTRRSLALLFPALAAAQQSSGGAEKNVVPSKAYPFEQLTGRQTATINYSNALPLAQRISFDAQT